MLSLILLGSAFAFMAANFARCRLNVHRRYHGPRLTRRERRCLVRQDRIWELEDAEGMPRSASFWREDLGPDRLAEVSGQIAETRRKVSELQKRMRRLDTILPLTFREWCENAWPGQTLAVADGMTALLGYEQYLIERGVAQEKREMLLGPANVATLAAYRPQM